MAVFPLEMEIFWFKKAHISVAFKAKMFSAYRKIVSSNTSGLEAPEQGFASVHHLVMHTSFRLE